MTVSSSTTSRSPRVARNFASARESFSRRPSRYAPVPASRQNVGATKCVIQRVKKMAGDGPPAGSPEYTRT